MPNNKHKGGHNHRQNIAAGGGHGHVDNRNLNNQRGGQQQNYNVPDNLKLIPCCSPTGCQEDPIDPNDPQDAVKVVCNNETCKEGNWMHKDCFEDWEQSVLNFLRSCGRARSWSERQRLQNLWTKKGYDLAYKACDCKCGRGHIRKDLDYFPPPVPADSKKGKKNKKKNDKPMPVVSTKTGQNSNQQLDNQPANKGLDNAPKTGNKTTTITIAKRYSTSESGSVPSSAGIETGILKSRIRSSMSESQVSPEAMDNSPIHFSLNHPPPTILNHPHHHQASQPLNAPRNRTNSVGSTGSGASLASSSGSLSSATGSLSPLSNSPSSLCSLWNMKRKPEPGADATPVASVPHPGIFRHRQDLGAFSSLLPRHKQNPYHLHVDEEGSEDTRMFVLNSLINKRVNTLRCVLCKIPMPVYDKVPLVDGTLFLSPQAYDQGVVQVIWKGMIQFLNAVCVGCLHGRGAEARCSGCRKRWDGAHLVVGNMYSFDIFAATPCCQKRLSCKHCRRAIVDIKTGLNFFSDYSQLHVCPYCKANDFHFVRSLADTFFMKTSICGQQ